MTSTKIHYTFTSSPKLSELKSLHHVIVHAEQKYFLLSNLVHAFWVHKINNQSTIEITTLNMYMN